jgi:PAS domain S-box-containing protein
MVNSKAQEFLNRGEGELLGKRFRREFPSLTYPSIFERYVEVIETGETLDIEEQQTFNGATYWLHLIAVKLNDGIVISAENITARKEAENKLREQTRQLHESAEKFRQLNEAIPQMTWTSQPDGYTGTYNQRWFDYTGLTAEQSVNWGWVKVIHPEEATQVQQAYLEAVQTGRLFEKEVRIRRHDGVYRWHLNITVPLTNEDGKIILWIGTATDIHEQKLANQELIESRHFIRQVAETSPDFIYVYDLIEEKNIYLNRNLLQTLGYSSDHSSQLSSPFILFKLVHPEDKSLIKSQIDSLRNAPDTHVSDLTYRICDADNKVRWFRDRATVFKRNDQGKPTQIVGIAQDVTTTVHTQQKLITEKELSESVLDNSIDGIVAFDTDACITAWNRMMEVYNGKLKEEVIGKRIFDLFPEYNVNIEGEAIQKALAGEKTVLHDHPYGLHDGYYETSNIPLFNKDGEVTGGLSIIHDITERKRLEDERINLRLNQQKEVLSAILETQEAERKRISESLHNGLGQLLYATKLKVNDLHY